MAGSFRRHRGVRGRHRGLLAGGGGRLLRAIGDGARFLLYTGFFIALIITLSYLLVVNYVKWEEEILMPDVQGLSVTEALEVMAPHRLSLSLDRTQPHPSLAEDRIIAQVPPPDQLVKTGSPVRVVVSSGMALVPVPDTLVGETRRAAGLRLRSVGLDEGNLARLALPGIEGGIVLATDPPTGAGVHEGTPVNLLISSGEIAALDRMPNLIGLGVGQARELLAAEGIQAIERIEPRPGVLPGRIHQQDPNPGAQIAPGDVITITLTPMPDHDYRPRRQPPPVQLDLN